MKVRFNRTTWRAFGGIVASAVVALSFQNCGKAGFDSSLDSSLGSASTDAALATKYGEATGALVAAVPFAFDTGFDQITYNSCSESTLTGQPGFFSIKAGAYQNMGIKLNSNFFSYVDSNFKPSYGESSISATQYASYLGDSPANKGAVANFAIRSKANLYNVYSAASSVTMGTDVLSLVGNLTDPAIVDGLTDKNAGYTSYFPFSTESTTIEATLTFNSSQSVAQAFRSVLAGDGLLAATYLSSASDPNTIRSPSSTTPMKTAYGKGYSLTFTQPASVNATSGRVTPLNIIGSITETDLSTGYGTGASWNCSRQYMIIRSQDQASYCPALTWDQLQDASIRRELEIARRQLRTDQWDINPVYHCAVPKGQVSCYNEDFVNGAAAGVNYFPGGDPSAVAGSPESKGECFNPLLQAGSYSTATIPTKRCANFITICARGF